MTAQTDEKMKERLALIRPLFGLDAALAVTDPLGSLPPPLPEETACLSPNAVEKRRREFAAGRTAARAAMADLGLPQRAIPVGPKRAPVWPAGVTGSITHTRSCAAAVAALEGDDLRALGIDLEEDTPLEEKLVPSICSLREQDWLKRQENPGQMAKVIFSAKEAAYKCQYFLSGRFFGFDGMELELDTSRGHFVAEFTGDQPPFAKGARIAGCFAIGAGLIATGAELRAGV
jgi:4'-phosphopantetheinyl transferase EntD